MTLRPLILAAALASLSATVWAHPAHPARHAPPAYAADAPHANHALHATSGGGHRAGPTATPRIDARQARQAARIRHGVASGALTAREAARLRVEQRHIARVERRAEADGVVTRHERARLTALQDRASRHIRWQTHDRQQAWR